MLPWLQRFLRAQPCRGAAELQPVRAAQEPRGGWGWARSGGHLHGLRRAPSASTTCASAAVDLGAVATAAPSHELQDPIAR